MRALGLCLLLGAGGAGYYWHQRSDNASALYSVQMREYVTPKGKQASLTLPDGSLVVLNVDSRLRVPSTYGQQDRTVYLDGEAQFTVGHKTRLPFSVHASGMIIRDLGTVFGVRAYPNQEGTSVFVAEGRVSVIGSAVAPGNAVVLAQGDLAYIENNGTTHVSQPASGEEFLAWTKGQLVFRNASVAEVLTQLSRWYDLEFRVSDTLLTTRRIDVTIPDRRWGRGVLETMSDILDAQGRQAGRVVTFTSRTP